MSSRDTNNIQFEKFQILECLKKDETGSVYKAKHLYLNKEIILKTLNRNLISDKTVISRFLREARILASIHHPNIIEVLDFGKHQEYLYISFAYFSSNNLREILNKNQLSEEQKFQILLQLIRGLAAVHSAGIIHRDLKPENILINPDLELKIADFGLALAPNENVVTLKSSIVGTPGYMSPEQVRGETLSTRSDLFSLGIIIYELYGNKNPFIEKDLNTTLNKILNFRFEQFTGHMKEVPEKVRLILENTLQNQPLDRSDSAADLLQQIDPDSVSHQSSTKSSKYIQKSAILSAVVIIVLVIVWLVFIDTNQVENGDIILSARDSSQVKPIVQTLENHTKTNIDEEEISEDPIKTVDLSEPTKDGFKVTQTGTLHMTIIPASELIIDSQIFTGIRSDTVVMLSEGNHIVEFHHPDFPMLKDTISIMDGQTTTIKIELDKLCAYFHCVVFPWGDVFINEKFIGQTPFFNFSKLSPGQNVLKIQNPNFRSFIDTLYINRGDTMDLQINLEKEVLK